MVTICLNILEYFVMFTVFLFTIKTYTTKYSLIAKKLSHAILTNALL